VRGKVWHAVDVVVDPGISEAVESALNQLDSIGIEIDLFGKGPGDDLAVTGYFVSRLSDADINAALRAAIGDRDGEIGDPWKFAWRTVEDQDWLTEWKKHWQPTRAGKFLIAPPWIEALGTDDIVIRIEPNMAFGTGTHETTQLCLEAISEVYAPGQSFLDVGTGTGILAIAAAKLGSTQVVACDTDIDAINIARSNAVDNGVDEHIRFFCGGISDELPVHDLVCANLTLDVICPILDLLLVKTSKSLILSGILAEQGGTIADELASRGVKPTLHQKGEWLSVIIDRAA